jgi:hypothetical protein
MWMENVQNDFTLLSWQHVDSFGILTLKVMKLGKIF